MQALAALQDCKLTDGVTLTVMMMMMRNDHEWSSSLMEQNISGCCQLFTWQGLGMQAWRSNKMEVLSEI